MAAVVTLNERYRLILAGAHEMLRRNVAALTLDEALFSDGGYRSILGVLKHIGGWTHVYRAYAFDPEPKHWAQTSWPRGLRDAIDASEDYLREILAWIDDGMRAWDENLSGVVDDDFDRPHPVHWGDTAALSDIVLMVANHLTYHVGELNMLLSIARGEAWEYGEEVEENHIDTYGHGVRGPWMTDDIARHYKEALRAAHEERQASARR